MPGSMIGAIVLAGGLLAAVILAFATGAKRLQRISGWVLAPVGVFGIVLYTIAYLGDSKSLGEVLGAVLHALFSTLGMFLGRSEYQTLVRTGTWMVENQWIMVVYWLMHLCAVFVSASVLLSTLGKKMLQTLRLRLAQRRRPVYLVYGLHEESLFLGRDLSRKDKGLVVYIAPKPAPEWTEQALLFGAVVRQEPYLPNGGINTRLMRTLGLKQNGKRCFFVLALDSSETTNIAIVRAVVDYANGQAIAPERLRLYLRSLGELDFSQLAEFEQRNGSRYDVDAFSDAELAARLLIHESPPYRTMQFDANGATTEDFSALIIGFGKVGQHTLRQIVMNSQFAGSKFTATVVDRDCGRICGQFTRRYMGMLQAYDIQFEGIDVRSDAFYTLLDKLAPKLKYIAVCLPNDDACYETTADLERYFARMDETERPSILVSVANKRYVATTGKNIRFFDRQQQVFSANILLRDTLDQMALAVNLSYSEYMHTQSDAARAWREASYFSRESCRASADFIPAMLYAAGFNSAQPPKEEAFVQCVCNVPSTLENLSITEHLRWNAFHFAMGYTTMTQQEVRQRAEASISPIQKDPARLLHACLISWNELDTLSKLVGTLTKRPELDYKELDRINVLQIPRTLALAQELDDRA